MRIFTIWLAMLLVLSTICYGIEASRYDFTIVEDKVHVDNTIAFKKPYNGTIELTLPEDARAISLYIDGKAADFSEEIEVNQAQEIRVKYVTQSLMDNKNFLANIHPGHNISRLSLRLKLPEGEQLKTPMDSGGVGGSVYPSPDTVTSDGQSIILKWEFSDIKEDDSLPIFVMLKDEPHYYPYIIAAVIGILSAIGVFRILRYKKLQKMKHPFPDDIENDSKKPQKIEITESTEKKEQTLKHLKDDEKQVIRVLELKEGSCEQGTLRIATNFSKAKLSRILMELEQRNVIYKEPRGKKNIIFLK